MNAVQKFAATSSSGVTRAVLSGGEDVPAATVAPCFTNAAERGSRTVSGGEVNLSTPAITAELPTDAAARDALLDRAMGPRWKKKSSHKLRRGRLPSQGLAFVAKDAAGSVLGTVRLWDVTAGECGPDLLLLGPLAVDPGAKSAGIGSALMRHAIAEASRLGHKAILLVGDAAYYARFGFSAEKTGRLAMPGPYERHRFLALELTEGALDRANGVLRASGRKAATERNAAAYKAA